MVTDDRFKLLVNPSRDICIPQVELRPGDFVYGGYDVEHGPFDYPEGCVVFAVFKGASAHHRYPGSPGGEM
jgi:hypothetical protein